ncbi:glycosyltransferase family 2 protein [Vibrio cholerae]
MKSFSVVVLTYNNYKLLKLAFKSLASQYLTEEMCSQLVIVDDGTENLQESDIIQLVDMYGLTSKYNVKIIVNKENIGTVRSFNKAISHCDGELIIPLSADDEFYDDFVILDIVDFFENNKDAEIVTFLRAPIVNGVEQQPLPHLKLWYLFNEPRKLYDHISLMGNIISGASTYYRRSFISNRKFNESYRYIEDFPLYLDYLYSGGRIYISNRLAIKYSTNGVSSEITRSSLIYNDYKNIWLNVLALNDRRGFYYKRFVYFNHILTDEERLSVFNFLKYMDIFIFRFAFKFFKKIKGAIK